MLAVHEDWDKEVDMGFDIDEGVDVDVGECEG